VGIITIRARFVLAVVACVGALLLVLLYTLNSTYGSEMEVAARRELLQSRTGFDSLLRRDTMMLSSVLDTIMTRADVRSAFARGDRDGLLALTKPLYTRLASTYGITHLYFEEPDGTVLLRVHKPQEHGDKLTRRTFRAAQESGTYGAGLELGKNVFALRVVHPLYREAGSADETGPAGSPQSGLLGYIEVGEEIDHFLGQLHDYTGSEVALLLSKRGIDRGEWTRMRWRNELPDDWAQYKDFVVAGMTSDTLTEALKTEPEIDSLPQDGKLLAIERLSDGRTVASGLVPIVDASGDVAGALYVTRDLTPRALALQAAQNRIVAASVLATALTAVVLVMLLNALVFSRLNRMARQLREAEGSALSPHFLPPPAEVRTDEIGEFESALTRYHQELEIKSMLLDEASDSVLLHDLGGRIIYANSAVSRARGYTREEFLGQNLDNMVSKESAAEIDYKTERLLEDGEGIFESVDLMKDGTPVPVEVHARVIEVAGLKSIASVVRDLTERKESERVIERLAYHDSLTGLANRELFQNNLSMALARMRRAGGRLGVAFLDLDRLKSVNDSLGHSAGDEVISIVGERLAGAVREGDTVARIGGDEFLVLFLDVDEDSADEVGDRIVDALKPDVIVGTHRIRITASVGLVFCEGGSESAETLIRRADLAMYSAKRVGGNTHCVHVERMSEDAVEQFELQNELILAVENHELEINYQPILSVLTGRVVEVEALLRWDHPVRGPVTPAAFIPLAEECGLMAQLGEWALSEVCRQAQSWRDQGIELRAGVNISARQLLNPDIVPFLFSVLEESGLPPDALTLEIAEGAAARQSQQVHQNLRAIREYGVRLCMDDFGMGYSSLSRVGDLDVDALKVDRSFVERMDRHPESWAIVKTIVSLGKRLELATIAEGVETQEQLELLRTMGCDMAQGYLLSAALPAAAIPDFVAEQERRIAQAPTSDTT
jgi:diguanylate cyclase (GGDEF)-like protein/PAS domain S-box-containing protein